jgi:hypothetical protein
VSGEAVFGVSCAIGQKAARLATSGLALILSLYLEIEIKCSAHVNLGQSHLLKQRATRSRVAPGNEIACKASVAGNKHESNGHRL